MKDGDKSKPRPSALIPIMIGFISLPAVLSLLYFKFTGDPTLRPLGVTAASLNKHDSDTNGRGITVEIDWGRQANTRNTPTDVQNALSKTLDAYAIDYQIRIIDVAGDKVNVYYLVDASRIGPYQLHNLSSGIPAALAAYEMIGGT